MFIKYNIEVKHLTAEVVFKFTDLFKFKFIDSLSLLNSFF